MAIKKSDIYRSLWESCDQLRGGMDASLYKDYILTLLFVKYVSDRAGQPDALIDVPDGASFDDMKALRGSKNIGEGMDIIIARIAEANDLSGVIDRAFFNDAEKFGRGPKMVSTLTALINIFSREELNFTRNRADGDDILGDAYEYLMRNFATEAGKSKGQFYTPAEVSRVVAAVAGVDRATSPRQTVYDPTCGSGSLLLKAAETARVPITIFGREMDIATRGLARMNMIMHNRATAEIAQGDVIADPHFLTEGHALQTFDFVVANPPFSAKAWAAGLTEDTKFGRFVDGEPPAKNGDFAFLLHVLASMKATGSGAIILPHGVLFRGNAEARLREKILKRGYIKGVIGLPANLFYGTGIPASIIVLDKSHARTERPLFMIDASKGFIKDGNKNRLRERDIHKIVDAFIRQQTIPGFSRLVPFDEIAGNDFNLNIPRYIDGSDPEDAQDITAHLHGGVPERDIDALADFWAVMPDLRATLFGPNPRAGYADPLIAPDQVRATIRNHPDFAAFRAQVGDILNGWIAANTPLLTGIRQGDQPRDLIHSIAEDMLARFAPAPLIDRYEAYQRLMAYWAATMQDDVFIIAGGGWLAARELREARKDSDSQRWLEDGDLTVSRVRLVADVIPPALITARFFPDLRAALDQATARAEELTRQIEELAEEHGAEGGLFEELMADAARLTAGAVKARLKDKWLEPDEKSLLKQAAKLFGDETAAKKAAKDAEAALTGAVLKKYPDLTLGEIQALVVDDKWLADISAAIGAEVEARTETLTARVRVLTERYGQTLGQIMEDLAAQEARVEAHLAAMGVAG
ncbi:MAG: class I SAM-dependent DNA methyltransferase [Paracoccus sp. (in: a-proteobacteria)]|nr:class I SAM-dependent DNA methyltransferase [Paracoccus sp. (in: a-proteobacteria)]